MPFLYLESIVDGAMKGIGEQKASFRYSVWDSILRIVGVVALLPRFGMRGFLLVIALSAIYTCVANTRRLAQVTGLEPDVAHRFGGPAAAALAATLAGAGLRTALQSLRQLLPGQWGLLAQLVLGGGGMALAYLAAAWPLGLGRALRRTGPKASRSAPASE
jgi:stage V sporulation protein B